MTISIIITYISAGRINSNIQPLRLKFAFHLSHLEGLLRFSACEKGEKGLADFVLCSALHFACCNGRYAQNDIRLRRTSGQMGRRQRVRAVFVCISITFSYPQLIKLPMESIISITIVGAMAGKSTLKILLNRDAPSTISDLAQTASPVLAPQRGFSTR